MNFLKSSGYTVINFESGIDFTSNISADKQMCGKSFKSSQLTIILFKSSILRPIYTEFFEDSYRERQLCFFESKCRYYKLCMIRSMMLGVA